MLGNTSRISSYSSSAPIPCRIVCWERGRRTGSPKKGRIDACSRGACGLTWSLSAGADRVPVAARARCDLEPRWSAYLRRPEKRTRGSTLGREQLEQITGKGSIVFPKAVESSGAENSRGPPHYKGSVGNEARKENWNQIVAGASHLQGDRRGAEHQAAAGGDAAMSGVLILLVLGFQSRLIL